MLDTPVFSAAAVAAPHGLAAEAGRAILAEGGNALEAMVAMAATIAVAYPHMNAVGGDAFWLVREPGGRVRAIEACGPAGSLATIERYRDKGYDAIPPRGPDAALTVAGAVGGWQAALDYARSLGAKIPLSVLLTDAVRLAREGCPVSVSEARGVPNEAEALHRAPGFAETFLVDGKTPPAGTVRKRPALADTLAHLAGAGLDDFYRGDVGREIAADLERIGSPVTRGDLEAFRARTVEPLSLRLPSVTLYNFPPPTQGLAALLILGIHERLGIRPGDVAAHHHGLVEAVKRAVAIRDRVCTDPAFLRHDPADFLAPAALAREAARIDGRKAARFPFPMAEGDTVWMGAIDGAGLAVSYIQSIYWEWGSGCVLPQTGIHWQNRGASFSLDAKGDESAGARPPPVPHADPGARRLRRRPRGGLRLHGRRRPAAIPGADLLVLPRRSRRCGRGRGAALAARPHLGPDLDHPQDGEPLRSRSRRGPRRLRPRHRGTARVFGDRRPCRDAREAAARRARRGRARPAFRRRGRRTVKEYPSPSGEGRVRSTGVGSRRFRIMALRAMTPPGSHAAACESALP